MLAEIPNHRWYKQRPSLGPFISPERLMITDTLTSSTHAVNNVPSCRCSRPNSGVIVNDLWDAMVADICYESRDAGHISKRRVGADAVIPSPVTADYQPLLVLLSSSH